MKKTIFVIFVILLCTLLLTGCWDNIELNTIGIVIAMALDKDDVTGNMMLTTQIVRPGALKKEGGGESSSPVEIITTQGRTVNEAITNISKQFDRVPYFAHVKVIVISEQLAQEGLSAIVDYLLRNNETKNTAWLIIAKDVKAKELLTTKHGIENVQATYLNNIIESKEKNSEVSASDVFSSLKAIASGSNPIIGVMEIVEQSAMSAKGDKISAIHAIKFSGTAAFKKDKLVGYLNNTETRGLNWITGKVSKASINIPSPDGDNKLITLTITKADSKITAHMQEQKIYFTIEINADADIAEQQDTANYFENIESFGILEQELGDMIKKEIAVTLNKVQTEFRSDIIGFGSIYNKKYPQQWKSIKDDWDNIFPTVSFEVKVDAKLRRLGLILKPIKSDDSK